MTGADHSSTDPPLPPTTEDDRFAWLRLLRSRRVGPSTFWRLLADHGSAQAALQALPEVARAAGAADYTICPEDIVLAELQQADRQGAQMLTLGCAQYPDTLAAIADAPPILWAIGDTGVLQRPLIAIVGARNASSLGTRMARKMAQDLSDAGFTIVSGLARGIDTVAHNASLTGGTIAVMAGGVEVIYPPENTDLAHEIGVAVLRVSDQPMGQRPTARHFPSRNRIISGLSLGTIVIEAAAKSGSLITARNAGEQGRDVFAVPGHPFDARASGCNMLLRDGATLVRGAQDVIDQLGDIDICAPVRQVTTRSPRALTPRPTARQNTPGPVSMEDSILHHLGPSPLAEDQLIRDIGVAAQDASPALVALELEGKIIRQPGGLISIAG